MRLGVLDIGSNSAQLQVVEIVPGGPPLPRHALREPTRLGDAFEPDGAVNVAGIERVAGAVRRAVTASHRLDADQLFVFATAAIRDAANRELVADRIENEAGVRPQFLTGEQEAQLTYLAAHRWYGWSAGRLLLVDIGGGTMEIVLGRDVRPELAVSLPLGAGRLTRRYLPDDRPSEQQVREMRRYVRDSLREVCDRLRWESRPTRFVAASKTFKQLARLAGAPPQRKGPFATRELTRNDLKAWTPRLAGMDIGQRAKLRGVSAARAGQILAGAVVAGTTMKALNIDRLDLCPWALREGIMLHYLDNALAEYTSLPLHPVTPRAIPARPANVLDLAVRHDGA